MDAGDHLDELGVAGGIGVLVDVAAVLGEGLRDEGGALIGVGGPPHGEVGVEDRFGVGGGGVGVGHGVSLGRRPLLPPSRLQGGTAITSQVGDGPALVGTVAPMSTISAPLGVGDLLRDWRQRRRLSQLDLSNEAAVSARHLSFVETGRSTPSRELVLHLAEHLDVPLRERNSLLMAAGYAPVYRERSLDDAEMDPCAPPST